MIETNKGVEEFDSADKALVWATMGGKTRRLIGGADVYARDTMAGFPRGGDRGSEGRARASTSRA